MNVKSRVDQAYLPIVEPAASAPVTLDDINGVRRMMHAAFPGMDMPTGVTREDYSVEASDGRPLPLFLCRPAGPTGPRALIYWIHGGGYYAGHFEQDTDRMVEWCLALGCTVASVEYRLAPEHPYPAALEDCYAGLSWLVEKGRELGVDSARVIVAGASAGGGLAAALSLLCRERGGPGLAGQLLLYPMLDDRCSTESSQWETYVWTRERNQLGWRSYLGSLAASQDVPPLAAPARSTDLAGLPQTLMLVGSIDILLDEDLTFARRLIDAGVSTDLHVFAGAPHGFDLPKLGGNTPLGRRASETMVAWLRRATTM